MYRFYIRGAKHINEYEELIRVFLRPAEYEITSEPGSSSFDFCQKEDKNLTKREIFRLLEEKTGLHPKWGIVMGIRPVKLFGMLTESEGDPCKAQRKLEDYYLVSREKAALTREVYEYQQQLFGKADDLSAGIYIGVPFCPTRCLYCSFASNPVDEGRMKEYTVALKKEIQACGDEMMRLGWHAESIYFGGGTPTSLSAEELDRLITTTKLSFFSDKTNEVTIEAGRPDTVTSEKLEVLAKHDIGRISINPQTMKQGTLKLIGRDHTVQDVRDAFVLARHYGIKTINADIIAGLPGESLSDFENTVEEVIALGADNVTVHSLAVKRSSRLKEKDPDYHYEKGNIAADMLGAAGRMLREKGYRPYYLYRQKHMSGALENVGYCLDDKASLYNVRIMDEHQRIIAMGAGGISKAYCPDTGRLSRVANVTSEREYTSRTDEMIQRKQKELFRRT